MRIAVTGAAGMLAHAVIAASSAAGHEVLAFDRAALDVTDAARAAAVIGDAQPDAIVHCAAYTRVDDAEDEPGQALLINATAARNIADAAAAAGALLVYPSTDYVFDGSASVPYTPDTPVSPLGAYGRSKLEGEHAARHAPHHHIVRTSWLYGAHGRNFVSTMLSRGRAGGPLRVVNDQRGAPTWTSDLAHTILGLLEQRAPSGVYHATNAGDTTWYDFAAAIFDIAGIDADLTAATSSEYPQKAPRPRYSVLDCSATWRITGPAPNWRAALVRALPTLA